MRSLPADGSLVLDALAVRRTCQILNVDTTQQNPDDAHPLFDRTKRPLLDHWRRNISFVLAKENVACFMHGVNNARNGQFQCDDQAGGVWRIVLEMVGQTTISRVKRPLLKAGVPYL